MTDTLFVKPARDAADQPLLVRDPASGEPLAADGEMKPRSKFWLRRLAQKDVLPAEPPTLKADAPKADTHKPGKSKAETAAS